ncbi:MAG: hypothetical protein JO019_03075 [Candidatus Kaiserbacteria bacterium]|nr:hypothetical protein [Candidatus Kaiserbacteria bacterium]
MLKRPAAWLPLAFSGVAIVLIYGMIAVVGTPRRQADEGTAAHLFQIWLLLEVLLITFFAIKWMPREPRSTFIVVVLQILAVAIGCFPIFYFNL